MTVVKRDTNTGKVLEVELTAVEHAVVRAFKAQINKGASISQALSRLSLRSSLTPNFVRYLTSNANVHELA